VPSPVLSPVAPVAAPPAPAPASHRKAAADFEAVLAGQLVRQMFDAMPRADLGGGAAEDIYRGLLAERIGESIARHGGIGVARSVETAMARAGGGQ